MICVLNFGRLITSFIIHGTNTKSISNKKKIQSTWPDLKALKVIFQLSLKSLFYHTWWGMRKRLFFPILVFFSQVQKKIFIFFLAEGYFLFLTSSTTECVYHIKTFKSYIKTFPFPEKWRYVQYRDIYFFLKTYFIVNVKVTEIQF